MDQKPFTGRSQENRKCELLLDERRPVRYPKLQKFVEIFLSNLQRHIGVPQWYTNILQPKELTSVI